MSKKLKNTFEPGQNEIHFFASNPFHWQAARDPRTLLDFFDTFRLNNKNVMWNLYLVPLPLESTYTIEHYAPVVDGLVRGGTYQSETAS